MANPKIIVPAKVRKVSSWARKMLNTEIRMRRHRVRGHFRVIKRDGADDKRTWVKDHLRGEGSLGWVNQDYLVSA